MEQFSMTYIPYSHRLQIVSGFDSWAREYVVAGWQPYFLNFMFKNIPGRSATKIRVMADEVSRVYSTLLPNVVRRPTAPAWKQYCPRFIGCPDLPVGKHDKDLVRNLNVNGGLHFNGCLLLPPTEKCRLGTSLRRHFDRFQERYYRDDCPLDRIHVTYIKHDTMIDYALKHFKRGNVSYDDFLILPRTVSELPD
jgi:hypothetical protein